MENFITCLRANLRKYLEDEISAGRLELEKAKTMAMAINEKITHDIQDRETLSTTTENLIASYPDLKHAFVSAQLSCRLDENKKVVDSEVIKLVELGKLDEALVLLNNLKK